MSQFITLLIIGLAGVIVGSYFVLSRRSSGMKPERRRTVRRKRAIHGAVKKRQTERDANINKLKEYLSGKETVTNDEIEKFLGISDSTATRYMDELENEGFVEQIGNEGRHVYYRVK